MFDKSSNLENFDVNNLYFYKVVVLGNYDGDTITVSQDFGCNIQKKKVKLRLLNVDTPEIRVSTKLSKQERQTEKKYARLAKEFVRSRLPEGSNAIILTERDNTGVYGRLLATVWYKDEKTGNWINLNTELKKAGLDKLEANYKGINQQH